MKKIIKLTKNYILEKVSQVDIFAKYLGIDKEIIESCIENNYLICSPLRNDNMPTCGFRYDNKGKLKMKDFAGYFWGDVFDVVALVMSNSNRDNIVYNVNNKQDFIKILTHISITFKDIFYGDTPDINNNYSLADTINRIRNRKTIIDVVIREWNYYDYNYWKQFNVPLDFLIKEYVFPVDQYYIDMTYNPLPKYRYGGNNDLCYAYNLGTNKDNIINIKLYFPNRQKHNKFIANSNHLEGILTLNDSSYDYIIITKSTKDRVVMKANMKNILSLYGEANTVNVGVINIPHETYKLRKFEYDWLLNKVGDNPNRVLSLMDNDITGIKEAAWLHIKYNITPMFIPKSTGCKDFAELISNNKYKEIKDVVTKRLGQIKQDT